ncbi:MAG TPA: hypothetical protein VGD43_10950, partial [Micromonospora sp.]
MITSIPFWKTGPGSRGIRVAEPETAFPETKIKSTNGGVSTTFGVAIRSRADKGLRAGRGECVAQ